MPRVREIIVQYRSHPSGLTTDDRQITTPADVAAILVPMLQDQTVEVFLVAHLDARRRLIGVQEVARGQLDGCTVTPRQIFAAAIGEKNSHALILAHNHPSGDPSPSPDDLNLTRAIVLAGRIFGITVEDHIIVGDQRYCSLRASGRMDHL